MMEPSKPGGRDAVLNLIKRQGPVSADVMAGALSITAMAVRQRLYALKDSGEINFTEEARPRGRPVKLWYATAAADAHFQDSHQALATDLIVQMKKAFGEDGLDKLLRLRNLDLEKTYRAKTDR